MGKNILFVSGGEYGDIYGASLATSLKDIMPAITVKCIGSGDKRRTGIDGPAVGTFNKELDSKKVDCIILADQPSFDLHFIKKAKDKGISVIYYAGAHYRPLNSKQLKKLTGLIDKVLAIFPFEIPLYTEAGINFEFVGHPLVDIVDYTISRDEAKTRLGYDITEVPVTFIPGGNVDEARHLLRLMVEGAAEAAEISTKKVKLVIPDAERYEDSFLNELIKISPRRAKSFKGQRSTALRASHGAVVIAGTPTIEAALSGACILTLQRTSVLSYFLSNLMGRYNFLGLPNIILDKPLFPELVQKNVTPKKITEEMVVILEDHYGLDERNQGLAEVREKLGPPGTIKRAAEAICRVVEV